MNDGFVLIGFLVFLGFGIGIFFFRYKIKQSHSAFERLSTERNQFKNKIEDLTHQKDQLSAILSGIYDIVFAVNREKEIFLYNEKFKQAFLVQTDLQKNTKLFEVVRVPEINEVIEQTLTQKAIFQKQIKIVKEDIQFFELICSPIFSTSKEVIGAVAILHDISELKALEKMRVDFVANVSHEFKTPLTSIDGYTQTLLKEGFGDPKQAQTFLKTIQHNVERLRALVEDLLTLSKIESQEKIYKETIPLKTLIENVCLHFKDQAAQKKITIIQDVQVDEIVADPKYMEQAVMNLVDNAIKYNKENGEVKISVLPATIKNNPACQILVKDTGPGIEAKHLPRIFERFYRGDPGRDRKLGGTGLGLAIVKHVAYLHRGDVDVKSDPDQGTIFRIVLPQL